MDIMTPVKRSVLMSRIRSKGTPEKYMDSLLAAGGLKFDQHVSDLPGTPDFVFWDDKVAVFVDGDFWQHRMNERWRSKIAGNRQRDRCNHQRLKRLGWTVVRVWEHEMESDVLQYVRRVAGRLQSPAVDGARADKRLSELPELKRRNRLLKP